ncbi:hypothetical protein ACPWZ5_18735 [Ralstonia pseudosolanacearum]|uniref:hypothetical protein n=1 Tax=Ralstonia pseudosolanacearum TaxID=1310165 RepID=UPI000B54CCC6|nr:chemotaxis protein CheY [Ralstonia solanacearum]
MARRRGRRAQAALAARATLAPVPSRPCGREPVDRQRLAPCNSYGEPEFARRGYYVDLPFTCRRQRRGARMNNNKDNSIKAS